MKNATICSGDFCEEVEDYKFPTSVNILLNVNGVCIIFLNLTVLLCLFLRRGKFGGNYWHQLTCLGINDVMSGVGVLLMTSQDSTYARTNIHACSFAFVMNILAQIATLLNLTAICFYRFVSVRKVTNPGMPKPWRAKYRFLQMALTWGFSAVYCSFPFVVWGRDNASISSCAFETIFENNYQKAVGFLFNGLMIPLVLTNILYVATFIKIRRSLNKIHCSGGPDGITASVSTEKSKSNDISTTASTRQIRVKPNLSGSGKSTFGISYTHGNVSFCADGIPGPGTSTSGIDARASFESHLQDSFPDKSLKQDKLVHKPDEADLVNATKPDEVSENIAPNRKYQRSISHSQCASYSQTQGSEFTNRQTSVHENSALRKSRESQKKRSFALIGLILLTLNLLTWPSALISAVAMVPSLNVHVSYGVKVGLLATITLNSLVNPFIYSFQVPEVRAALKDFLIRVKNTCSTQQEV